MCPACSYYYATFYTGPNATASALADFREQAWPGHVALWSSYADESCVAALSDTPYACMLANYSYPYIAADSFAIEAQTDQVRRQQQNQRPAATASAAAASNRG